MDLQQTELKRYIRKIKDSKAKITPQRIEILKIFLNNKTEHLTADEIINKLNSNDVGQATVYRTLDLFCQAGILKKVNFTNEDIARYDFLELTNRHFHHHLICNKCGKVIEINDDLLEDLEEKIHADYDFEVLNHELVIRGLCADCQKRILDDEEES